MEFVYNQLIYFAFLQSCFLLVIYGWSGKIRRAVNPYLMVLIIVLLVGFLGRIWLIEFDGVRRLYSLSEYAVFLFGPTVFLFARSSLAGDNTFKRRDWVHYLPAVIWAVVLSAYYVFAPKEVISARFQSGELFWFVVCSMGAGLALNSTYWYLSVRLFLSVKRQISKDASYTVRYGFFQGFLIAVGLCLLTWLAVYVVGTVGESWLEREVRPFIWLALALLMLFISYYSIREPELFKAARQLKATKYAQSKLTDKELEQLRSRLEDIMEEKKPYLNRNLMKADLADMLGVNQPDVARLLNEKIGMNFFEYVNYFRIKEFIELAKMDTTQHLTFFGIAQEAGFNSKTTFNKSFKKIMGTSPREYFAKDVM